MIYESMKAAVQAALKEANKKDVDRVLIQKSVGGFTILTIYWREQSPPTPDSRTMLIIS